MIKTLKLGEELEATITIPKSLVQIINITSEKNSLIITIGIMVDSWKKFLPELKAKYKIIF